MIHLERLHYAVGGFALQDVTLDVRPGEYFVLLGPTGSGKTLLVECLCGLNRIDSGSIRIDGIDVTQMEPRQRGIGYVPQDYALFPHKTVRQNVRFGLQQNRSGRPKLPRDERGRRESTVMGLVGVEHLAERFPEKLSGGEKQRVALARALAIEPKVLLLDEPVSALDEATRDVLCRQLKRLQRAAGTTTIHVCHNFAEMLTVADRVGIIYQGRIVQVGTPPEVLGRPNNTLVARFVQGGNLLPAQVQSRDPVQADGPWMRLLCAGNVEFFASRPPGGNLSGQVTVMARPENICLATARPQNLPPGTTLLQGTIRDVAELGPVVKVTVAVGGEHELSVSLGKREFNERRAAIGQRVYLTIAAEHVHVMQE
jgi:ABC-type Fe3+/spermidine/putrescine transport system ATPase subunit